MQIVHPFYFGANLGKTLQTSPQGGFKTSIGLLKDSAENEACLLKIIGLMSKEKILR
jgi:hypothetical protein